MEFVENFPHTLFCLLQRTTGHLLTNTILHIMDLRSHYPYWLMKDGLATSYTSLKENIKTDIAIIGAGISGALIAYYLRDSGFSVTVIDRRHTATGSTAASTSFLQYEIDVPMHHLAEKYGTNHAVTSYRLCREAIDTLGDICKKTDKRTDFKKMPSLQFASYKKDVDMLETEYRMRKQHGFDVALLGPEEVGSTFGMNAPAALLSADAATMNAYLLTHYILKDGEQHGQKVYNNTDVVHIDHTDKKVILHTDKGYRVQADKLIIACGYESSRYLPHKVAAVHSTYAVISEPMPDQEFWYRNSLVWETAQPYLYFRIADNNRILIGGKDDPYHNPRKRDANVRHKAALLQQAFNKRKPGIPFVADMSWAGAFSVTKDGLPYIGSIRQMPRTYFALGFGGNGITFSAIAADIISRKLQGKKHPGEDIFSFDR